MEGMDRFDIWQANVENLRSQLLLSRSMFQESLEKFDPDGRLGGAVFLEDAMAWRRYMGLLDPSEQREMKRLLQSLGLASFQSLQTLEKITKELAYLDETSYHVERILRTLHSHAHVVRDHFLDSSPEQKDQV